MRSVDEVKEYPEENLQDWHIELLKKNPDYVFWGPHEDYMSDKNASWASPIFFDSWREMFSLDELNEVVNFYFDIERKKTDCTHCDGIGNSWDSSYHTWYDHQAGGIGKGWHDKLTQDEVDKLYKENRLHSFSWSGDRPTAKEINTQENMRVIRHDAINRWICVKVRDEREGRQSECPACEGHGYILGEEEPLVKLILWVLHPRKGCSRGVEIRNIQREELPEVFTFLRKANERNNKRFSGVYDNDE